MSPASPNTASPLRERLAACRARALSRGALQPIATRCEVVDDGGLPFAVHVLSSAARKAEARHRELQTDGPRPNPFLPYDEDLYVGPAGPDHACLLNKFNVVDEHLLVVTRAFEAQETRLTPADFAALWELLWEEEGLAFYNSGTAAGASQPHRHLQLVLGPLCPGGPALPIGPACERALQQNLRALPELPLAHAFQALPGAADAGAAAAQSARLYDDLLASQGLVPQGPGSGRADPAPYNLLLTRTWMMVVPRERECFGPVSVNALGFAGALLVRNDEELALLTARGPLEVLRHVGLPRSHR